MIPVAFVILAAGMGTRMRSAKPKVLHQIAGRSMLAHVLSTAAQLRPERISVVVGPDMDDVAGEARRVFPGVEIAVQEERLGTADAVRAALPSMRDFSGALLVLFGDTPLITADTLQDMRGRIDQGGGLAVLGFQSRNPHGYGRLILDDSGNLVAIREDADLAPMERNINLCNSGVMAFNAAGLGALIGGITNNNSKGEYYLTDAVQIAALASIRISVAQCPEDDVMGINDRSQLAVAEAVTQDRLRLRAMSNGATLSAPETVFFSHDTKIGQDVLIEPNVVFGPGVMVEDGVTIRSFSHLEGCLVREFAQIGPYARLRPEADIGDYCKVGNFVEIKKAVMEHGSKVNHLTYIGDARVGSRANVGAGTITCNYDGENKHHTDIGDGAFIGSNSSLVAPVNIGDGAYVGSGSVITRDVPADSLAVSRSKQVEREGWAARKRGKKVAAAAATVVPLTEETVPEPVSEEELRPQEEQEPVVEQADGAGEQELATGQDAAAEHEAVVEQVEEDSPVEETEPEADSEPADEETAEEPGAEVDTEEDEPDVPRSLDAEDEAPDEDTEDREESDPAVAETANQTENIAGEPVETAPEAADETVDDAVSETDMDAEDKAEAGPSKSDEDIFATEPDDEEIFVSEPEGEGKDEASSSEDQSGEDLARSASAGHIPPPAPKVEEEDRKAEQSKDVLTVAGKLAEEEAENAAPLRQPAE